MIKLTDDERQELLIDLRKATKAIRAYNLQTAKTVRALEAITQRLHGNRQARS